MIKTILSALAFLCFTTGVHSQTFEKDADGIYQKLKQRAQKNGFRKFVAFTQGTPAFIADPGTEYRIAFIYDFSKADTLRADLHEIIAGEDKIVLPAQVLRDGPREGTAATSIIYYTSSNTTTGPISVKLDVFPMGYVYIYKRK